MKQTKNSKRFTEVNLGSYRNVNIHNMTNLFLYGTLETPPLEQRVRVEEEYAALPLTEKGQPVLKLTLEMSDYMTEGPGRYAHASMAPFIQKLFDMEQPASLLDGSHA